MGWLKTAGQELVSVFVDDGRFALAIVVWLIVLGLGLPHVPLTAAWHGVLLFGGLAAILVESALRKARRR